MSRTPRAIDMDAAIREALLDYENRRFCFVGPVFRWHVPPSWSYESARADERMEHLAVRPDARL